MAPRARTGILKMNITSAILPAECTKQGERFVKPAECTKQITEKETETETETEKETETETEKETETDSVGWVPA